MFSVDMNINYMVEKLSLEWFGFFGLTFDFLFVCFLVSCCLTQGCAVELFVMIKFLYLYCPTHMALEYWNVPIATEELTF